MSQIPLRFLDLIPRDYFYQRDINVINRKSRGYDDLIGIKGCIISRDLIVVTVLSREKECFDNF